ncbi:hypothetical protein K7432_007022 [Basidiobolus ranarum]|uniref:Uncharacterized protein n=1 Tax=Basidiobolus ranarum TaxID=34480 RepID=A0ABR2WU17_9FUNG
MSTPTLSTAPLDEQLIPPRTSSMIGTGILEVDDQGNLVLPRSVRGVSMTSASRPISLAENNPGHLSGSSNEPSQRPAIPIGILSRHILQKKHLRQQLLLHIAAETLITTGTITILKQVTVVSWVIWVVFSFVLLVLFPFQLWKYRARISALNTKLQQELDTYLTLIRTYARTDNEEYEYDPLHLVPPPPTYAIAKEQPPAYFIPPTVALGHRASSRPRLNAHTRGHGLLPRILSIDTTAISIPQISHSMDSVLESDSPLNFRPPSYRSTDSVTGLSTRPNTIIAMERNERSAI